MAIVDLKLETLDPRIDEVLQNRVDLLNANKIEIDSVLSEAGYPDAIAEIRYGHRRRHPDYPIVEIVPTEGQWPWGASSAEDLIFHGNVVIMIRNIEADVKYTYISVFESAVRTVINHPRNLQFKVRDFQLYDSKCSTTGFGTLDQGQLYACQMAFEAKLWRPRGGFNQGEAFKIGGFEG